MTGLSRRRFVTLAGAAVLPPWWRPDRRARAAKEWWARRPATYPPVPPATPVTAPLPDPMPAPPSFGTLAPQRTITIDIPELPMDPPAGWYDHPIGWSVLGRSIQRFVRPADGPRTRRVLVIANVHGNERGCVPIAATLMGVAVPAGVEVSVVPTMNPDGWAADSRFNARNVDLNRNFPWRWLPSDGGPAPASEPETQAVIDLVQAVAWDAVVWLHQPLGYVAAVSPTDPALATVWSLAAGLPTRDELDQHGGGETWTAKVAGRPAVLVEVATHDVTREMVEAHAAGFAAVLLALARPA